MRLARILVVTALSLTSGLLLATAASAGVDIGISVNIAPPELPVYEQPPIPGPGYIWSPGYWAWGDDDYYWVPGTWVLAPEPGFLWTPGYWGWADGAYFWHAGYWGPHVGFYGGVNYGFGYGGRGYEGGEWREGRFYYNRSVNNIPQNVHITNVYNRTVNNVTVNRVSFNGGNGGIAAQASAAERADANERHLPPVGEQMHHEQSARSNPQLHASANHGVPPIAATAHPAAFSGPGVVGARGAGPVHPGTAQPGALHPSGPQPGMTHSGPTVNGLAEQASQGSHAARGTPVPGPSHPAQVVAPHPGPTPPGTVQSAPHTFKPSTPGAGMGPGGGGHAPPPAPRVEHQAPPAHTAPPHAGPEHGGNADREHEREH